jgi:phospholipid/cholesterol/gamma-HCH transport system substrate-binding protein
VKEEIKAGIIIVASLVILSIFVILIGGSQFMNKYDKYYVRVLNAAGLETGAQVKLGGVRVGRVLSVREPDGPGRR